MATNQSSNLLPCPFCGKSDIHIEQKGTFFWCECYDCGASSREHHTLPGVNILQSEGFARGYWNNRPIEDELHARIAELEAENAELKERVAMLDITAVFKSLGEMGYIEQTNRLHTRIAELEHDLTNKEIEYTDLWDDALAFQARIAELKELLDTESQLSNQFYLLLVDNPKSKKLADDLIEALRINGKEVQE